MTVTVTAADARAQFSRIAAEVSRTGEPVTVFKNSRPWVVIQPAQDIRPTSRTKRAMAEAQEVLQSGQFHENFTDLLTALEGADAEV